MNATTDQVILRQPFLMRVLVRASWSYRRPRLWAGIRLACGVFNLVVAGVLLSSSQQTGSLALLGLLPLAGSGLLLWTAYRLMLVADGL
jgi:threonine/homoserine/homoserine lactone efflux protein